MTEWYKNSNESVFRIYGKIYDKRLPTLLILQGYCKEYLNDPNLEVLNTSVIYTIGSFLFFKEDVLSILDKGEKKPLSLYYYFIGAIKSLGDVIDLIRKIRKIIIDNCVSDLECTSQKIAKERYYTELESIDDNFCHYAKEFRNILCHEGYPKLRRDGKQYKIDPNCYKKNDDIDPSMPCNKIIPLNEFLDLLFNNVVLGIEAQCDYLIKHCLNL